jgi:DNA (cytosine-5)-methyltransferase 1
MRVFDRKAVSIFSGCLGLDLGLEAAGIQIGVAVESDPACQRTIKLNRPHVPLYADVREVNGELLRAAAGGKVDVLAGGPPCQAFSTIGPRSSMKDERGRLLMDYLRLLEQLAPSAFVFENVTGLLSASRNGGPLFPWLLSRLRRLGYVVSWWKLNALDYGSPQRRMRVIITGSLSREIRQPQPCHGEHTLATALADLTDSGECGRFSPRTASILEQVPPGGNWRSLPRQLQDQAMGNASRKSGGLTAFYRRLAWDRPSPTLVTVPTGRATTLCHPDFTRPLSIAEYARIQGFPEGWLLAGSTAQKYRQLGNAVPVPLAEAIGRTVVCQ